MAIIDSSQDLGALIRDERKRQALTQEQLAALSGVGVRFMRELEHGKESCQVGLALTVMQTLGLTFTVKNRDNDA